jgi:hypothetical protein
MKQKKSHRSAAPSTAPAEGQSRRDFLVGAAALAAAATAGAFPGCKGDDAQTTPDARVDGPLAGSDGKKVKEAASGDGCGQPSALTPVTGSARVVDVTDTSAVSGKTIVAARVKTMLLEGLAALAGTSDAKTAWAALLPDFTSSMKIGIKVNCLSSYVYSSSALVTALVETLVNDLGASAAKILVWDRYGDELDRAKLTSTALGATVMGTAKTSTDSSGPGYETKGVCIIDQETHLSKILTTETDVTINLALLKTHGVSGVTGALKNVYGCIDNPGDFHTSFDSYMPAIYRLDGIRKRLRLHITEGLLAVVKGETSSPADRTPGRLLLSADPVALDTRALAVINSLRSPAPGVDTTILGWLDAAAKLNLGTKSLDLKTLNLGPADGGVAG